MRRSLVRRRSGYCALMRANKATFDRGEVRRYFRLFDREAMLDELLATLD